MSTTQPQPLPELVSAIADELQRQGVACELHHAFPPPRLGLVYLLVSPRDFVRTNGESALPGDGVLGRTVCLGAEDPGTVDSGPTLGVLRAAGAVFDVSQRAVTILHRHGVAARLLRPGYVAAWNRYDPTAPRPIDILFYGTRSDRRVVELAAAADVLARHRCVIHLAQPGGHVGDSPTWLTAARWPLLAQSKVVVNLHRGDGTEVEWLRMLDAFHSGAVFVTEHAYGMTPFAPGEHLLVGAAPTLPHLVAALLRDESALVKMRERALDRLRGWLPLEAPVSILRAAIVELVGRPISGDAHLGVPGDPDGVPAPARPASDLDVMGAELRDARSKLAAARQELRQLRSAPAPLPAASPTTIRRNPAWNARRAASVSVLLAVGEFGSAAISTLDSLVGSRMRDLELIVVAPSRVLADGLIHRWLREHPRVASTLLAGGSAGGRAAARNLALGVARSRCCLMLDPGVTLHPRALGELLSALDGRPDIAFVYPIQVVSGDPTELQERGMDPLMSSEAWDPSRSSVQNPGETPALVRTAVLREIGGYEEDSARPGMEDADLWTRLTERGHQGRLVPQIIARRGFEEALRTHARALELAGAVDSR